MVDCCSGILPRTAKRSRFGKGTIGLERDYGSGNQAHSHALAVMVERFCSPGVCHPRVRNAGAQAVSPEPARRSAAKTAVDPRATVVVHDSGGGAALDDAGFGAQLLSHLKETTHFVVADGALDGQIAFEALRTGGYWPNLVARHYDQAHGARRITQRPWQADEETQDVVDTLITGKQSLTMLFSNSPALQGYLQSNIDKLDGGGGAKPGGLASGIRKHRYDSTQMPLARQVLRHQANVATAIQLAQAYKGDHIALCCEYFLFYVSGQEGIRRLLLLAMLADAGDEASLLVRAQDESMADPANTAFLVASFVRRVQALFLEGSCWRAGFTEIMLETLKKPMGYVVRGTPLQCGNLAGPAQADLEHCLRKLSCWVRSAISVLRAEFPDFTLLHSFSVFKLDADDLGSRHKRNSVVAAGHAQATEKISTLAAAFGCDGDAFAAQFSQVQLMAQAVAREECSTNDRDAWRIALQRLQRRRHWKGRFVDVEKVVAAYLGWQTGTGDVERAFSTHDGLFCGHRRKSMSRQREQDVITLSTDYVQREAAGTVEAAIEIWKKLFYNATGQGKVREGRRDDVGIKRRLSARGKGATMANLLAKRRRVTGQLTQSSGLAVVSTAEIKTLTDAAWTPALAKEDKHMRDKRGRRVMEFLASGGHLPAHQLGGMSRQEIVDIFEANEARLEVDRQKKSNARQAAFAPKARRNLANAVVKWEPDTLQCPATIRALHLRTLAKLPAASPGARANNFRRAGRFAAC